MFRHAEQASLGILLGVMWRKVMLFPSVPFCFNHLIKRYSYLFLLLCYYWWSKACISMDDVHVLFRLYLLYQNGDLYSKRQAYKTVCHWFFSRQQCCVHNPHPPPTAPPHPPPLPTYFKEGAEAAVKPLCCTEEAFTVHTQISFIWPHHACNRHPAGTSGELQGANWLGINFTLILDLSRKSRISSYLFFSQIGRYIIINPSL